MVQRSQGVGNACLRWIAQANSMILAYKSLAIPWTITMPDFKQQFIQLIDTFIDDTSITNAKQKHQNTSNLLRTSQQNFDIWHDLLQASGGVLNPSKCVWLCFNWKFAANGTASVSPPPTMLPPLQTTIGNQLPMPICRLQPRKPTNT